MFVVKDPECQYQIEERSWHSAGITGFGARFLALLLWFQRSRVIWWGSRWEPSVSAQYLKGTISIYLDKKGGQMLAKQESKVWYTPSEREVTAQRTRQRSKMQSFHACFTLYHCRLIYFFFFFWTKTETRTCSSWRFMHFENNSEEGRAWRIKAERKPAGMLAASFVVKQRISTSLCRFTELFQMWPFLACKPQATSLWFQISLLQKI